MKMGTRSLLFGAHQFLLHPLCVAYCWWRLYGFPWDPRLWVAFLVHDWGYFGCSDMDGEEGQWHPITGSVIMYSLFGEEWGNFALLHSRTVAKMLKSEPSRLCNADKMASVVLPASLYVFMVRFTGEVREYRSASKHIEETGHTDQTTTWEADVAWYKKFRETAHSNYGWNKDA